MLTDIDTVVGLALKATDGEIGTIKDVYFDDQAWAVQYFVADTGGWLSGRKVLISPQSVDSLDWEGEAIRVSLTRRQVEDSPPISEDEPISHRAQRKLGAYYNWGMYWAGYPGPGGIPTSPGQQEPEERPEEQAEEDTEADPHLRSLKEVTGYAIQASDGEIGHLDSFIVQTDEWALRYMVVDTRNWLPGRKVLVSPAWIKELDWLDAHLVVDMDRESIQNAPEFNPDIPLVREYEERLYDHYGRPKYWESDTEVAANTDRRK